MTASPDVTIIVSLQGAPGAPATIYCVDQGAANALLVAIPQVLTQLPEGLTLLVKVADQNTGATTITVETAGAEIGPVAIVYGGQPLPAAALGAGLMAMIVFDGVEFQLMALSVTPPGGGSDTGGFFFPSGQVADAATVL
jgi:hypothetical protein